MKRWLAAIALAGASYGFAQEPFSITKADYSVPKNGGIILPAGYLTIKDETTALTGRGTLTFLGSAVTCVDNAVNSATECTVTSSGYALVQDEGTPLTARSTINFTGSGVSCTDVASVTTCAISSGGAPTGATYITQTSDATLSAEQALSGLATALLQNTTGTGVLSAYAGASCTNQFVRSLSAVGAATCNTVDVASGGTGIGSGTSGGVPYFSAASTIASSNALGANAVVIGGGAGAAPSSIGTGTAGQVLISNGASAPAFGDNPDPTKWSIVFDDMMGRGGNGTTATWAGLGFTVGSGTSACGTSVPGNIPAGSANHPGIINITTGSATTGTCSMMFGQVNNDTTDTIVISGSEVFEWDFYIPTASDGTNTFKIWAGACDTVANTGDCTDGAAIYWDNNTDTHWGCLAANAASRTTTISTNTATAAAWHKARVEFNAAGTSVTYKVDGSELSCSPIATGNVPNGRGLGGQFRRGATAGCATTTTCTAELDYYYFRKPVTR